MTRRGVIVGCEWDEYFDEDVKMEEEESESVLEPNELSGAVVSISPPEFVAEKRMVEGCSSRPSSERVVEISPVLVDQM